MDTKHPPDTVKISSYVTTDLPSVDWWLLAKEGRGMHGTFSYVRRTPTLLTRPHPYQLY